MPIDCACPHCNREFKVKDLLAGRKTYCPGCKKLFRIPTLPADQVADRGTEPLEPLPVDDAVAEMDVADDGTSEEPLQVECPLCNGRIPFDAKAQGQITTCPKCRKHFRIPTL